MELFLFFLDIYTYCFQSRARNKDCFARGKLAGLDRFIAECNGRGLLDPGFSSGALDAESGGEVCQDIYISQDDDMIICKLRRLSIKTSEPQTGNGNNFKLTQFPATTL